MTTMPTQPPTLPPARVIAIWNQFAECGCTFELALLRFGEALLREAAGGVPGPAPAKEGAPHE